jgi:hypothetical protein
MDAVGSNIEPDARRGSSFVNRKPKDPDELANANHDYIERFHKPGALTRRSERSLRPKMSSTLQDPGRGSTRKPLPNRAQ